MKSAFVPASTTVELKGLDDIVGDRFRPGDTTNEKVNGGCYILVPKLSQFIDVLDFIRLKVASPTEDRGASVDCNCGRSEFSCGVFH